MPTSEKELRDALEPFARVWRVNRPLEPDPNRPLIDFLPHGMKLETCKRANDLLVKLKHRF